MTMNGIPRRKSRRLACGRHLLLATWLSMTLVPSAWAGEWVGVAHFGAVGDGVTDDAPAIQKAMDDDADLVFENKTYLLGSRILLRDRRYKRVDFRGATLVKADPEQKTIAVLDSTDIHFTGGTFVCAAMPKAYAKSVDAHTFLFIRSQRVTMRNVRIDGSGQMGVCVMDSGDMLFENNTIRNCFRDGIYSHHSANVRYLHNRLEHIKDDALSFHDYGRKADRPRLEIHGYPQASRLIAVGNVIRNAYQGIAAIAVEDAVIRGNEINGVVNAGICVFNSDHYGSDGAARVKNVVIDGNIVRNAGKATAIMGREYPTGLDTCTARAAITAQSHGRDMLMPTATRRLENVVIRGNIVEDCGAQGIFGHFVDNLSINGNLVANAGESGKESLQNIIETVFCANVSLRDNSVVDSRRPVRHGRGWSLRVSTGSAEGMLVQGVRIEPGQTDGKAPFNWQAPPDP